MTNAPRLSSPALSIFSILFALGAPSLAHAQAESDDHLRVGAHLALGFGGELDFSIDSGFGEVSAENDAEPSIGFGLRAEKPLFDFLSIGGLFEAISVQGEDVNAGGIRLESEREWLFNVDLLLRARYMFEVIRGDLFLEPYVAVPIGFSFAMATVPGDDDDSAWPGWNTGVLAGATAITSLGIGGFLELGWRHADVFNSDDSPVEVDYAITLNEFALNLGAVFLL